MPYIITTTTPPIPPRGRPDHNMLAGQSRRAVATLEEARQDARNIVEDHAQEPGWTDGYVAAREVARTLPESGDTVGPLPDGTVIEVEREGWNDLISAIPDSDSRFPYFPPATADTPEIIAAYNAAQS